jgi:septal ring factor EnvC (AmiA/AmiB activator)
MGDPLLEAYVELKADASNLDAVLDKLPPKVARSVAAAAKGMKPLQDEIAKQETALKAYIATLTGMTPKQIKANDTVKEMSAKLEGLQGQLV